MAKLKDIARFLDKELDIKGIEDSSHNGLQVENSGSVKKIGFAVDACMDVFRKAKKEGCDLVVVHHGLFWGDKDRVVGNLYRRIRFLIDNDIAVYAAHLPLDVHKKYGNNALLFKMVGAVPKEVCGKYGYVGDFKTPKRFEDIIKILKNKLDAKCKILKYGPDKIKRIAIISGGAAGSAYQKEVIAKNADMYITGEIHHGNYHRTKESKMHYVAAGHYATETVGVKALMPVLKKRFGTRAVFLDVPTGL